MTEPALATETFDTVKNILLGPWPIGKELWFLTNDLSGQTIKVGPIRKIRTTKIGCSAFFRVLYRVDKIDRRHDGHRTLSTLVSFKTIMSSLSSQRTGFVPGGDLNFDLGAGQRFRICIK